jgi:hypothetical protein
VFEGAVLILCIFVVHAGCVLDSEIDKMPLCLRSKIDVRCMVFVVLELDFFIY